MQMRAVENDSGLTAIQNVLYELGILPERRNLSNLSNLIHQPRYKPEYLLEGKEDLIAPVFDRLFDLISSRKMAPHEYMPVIAYLKQIADYLTYKSIAIRQLKPKTDLSDVRFDEFKRATLQAGFDL